MLSKKTVCLEKECKPANNKGKISKMRFITFEFNCYEIQKRSWAEHRWKTDCFLTKGCFTTTQQPEIAIDGSRSVPEFSSPIVRSNPGMLLYRLKGLKTTTNQF